MSIRQYKNSSTVTTKVGSTFSGQVSYCKHTHIAIVLTNSFQFGATRGEFIAAEHPVFHADTKWLERTYLTMMRKECGTTTEKYLLVTAMLRAYGLLDTSRCGLHLGSEEFYRVWDAFGALMTEFGESIRASKLPKFVATYVVSENNASSGRALACYLKELQAELHHNYAVITAGKLPAKTSKQMLDDEIELEQELKRILNSNSGKYLPKHGKAACLELGRLEHIGDAQVNLVRKYLFAEDFDKLHTGVLRQVIDICANGLDFTDNFTRVRNLLVMRHLEAKLETILNIEKDAGFILLEMEAGKADTIKYQTRTKVTETSKIETVRVASTTATGEKLGVRAMMELRRRELQKRQALKEASDNE